MAPRRFCDVTEGTVFSDNCGCTYQAGYLIGAVRRVRVLRRCKEERDYPVELFWESDDVGLVEVDELAEALRVKFA